MIGCTPHNSKPPNVNKYMVATSIMVVVVMFGSLGLRDLLPTNKVIQKVFGGLNLLLFLVAFFTIYYSFEKWIFKIRGNNSSETTQSKRFPIIILWIVLLILVVFLFYVSIKYLDKLAFSAFWIILVVISWIVNIFIDRSGD